MAKVPPAACTACSPASFDAAIGTKRPCGIVGVPGRVAAAVEHIVGRDMEERGAFRRSRARQCPRGRGR